MGTTPIFAIPYVEPTGKLAEYPAADKAQAETLEASLGGKPFCEAVANATQAQATSTETLIVYQTSLVSQAGMFTNGGSAITIPVNGLYLVVLGYSWTATTGLGSRIVLLKINGVTNRSWNLGSGNTAILTGQLPVVKSLTAGMTVGMAQYHSAGSSVTTNNQSYPSLTVARLGPPPV